MNAQNTPPKRALLIFNPKSGNGQSPLPRFIAALGDLGWQVDAEELPKEGDLEQVLGQLERYRAVIAAGGDGTVSSLAYALKYSGVPLMAYPAGTANLIAQNLDLPDNPEALAKVVDDFHTVELDLGELTVEDQVRGFTMLAGAGADATMISESEKLKEKLGVMAYVVSAMKQFQPKFTTFTLEYDGQVKEIEAMAVMVANLGMANFRLPIASGVSPTDGKLTVLILKPGSVFDLLGNVLESVKARLGLGDVANHNIESFHTEAVVVKSAEPFPLQFDGEIRKENTPFSARVLPGAVKFLTQEAPKKLDT
ncbi:diacylglycerol/lipid kinase family protein [Deinococcus irradiatisoli]|uniref:diacylglycerol/lipid kinase family protein n=1 Tax=Deinococcus irradiatisoli TaxID=2202254 RepID=UPI0015E83C4A|nr:diacylglycerol kinase family protein [Deinococcus irradiatisoli]